MSNEMMTTETGITTRPAGTAAMIPETSNKVLALMDAADRLGTWMAKAYRFKNLEQGKVAAMTCLTEGLKPAEFFNMYHVLENGQLQMTANAMLSKFIQLGGKCDIKKSTEEECVIEFTWKGKTVEQSFTIEQAKKKGLVKQKSAWDTWPEDQLIWTVVRKYMRRYVPEHFAGIFTPEGGKEEEMIDYHAPEDEPEKVQSVLVNPEPAPPEPTEPEPTEPEPPEPEPPEPEQKTIEPNADNLRKMFSLADVSEHDAIDFMVNVAHWLEDGEGIDALIPSHIEQIMRKFDGFKKTVAKYAEDRKGGKK